ncbi:MAG: hypothetical protein IPM98_09820 [Lewinellaceae bacterium]|nr:hypothetical protein [Lewinellaceae bacterium]
MKLFVRLLGLGLLLFGQPRLLSAQEAASPQPCHDMLHLRDGSRLRGQITATLHDGKTLAFRTWGGAEMEILRADVQRIVQRCNDRAARVYNFREKGWYHHTRAGILPGQTYYGYSRPGLSFQHSSGWMFSRRLGVGLGTGMEFFDRSGNEPAVYPIFAEVRSYLLPRRITPFGALACGWSFSEKNRPSDWGSNEIWKGGWMAQATVGYRIGNNLTIQGGIRLQHRQREWSSSDWWIGSAGTDRILHKRLMLGIGLLL